MWKLFQPNCTAPKKCGVERGLLRITSFTNVMPDGILAITSKPHKERKKMLSDSRSADKSPNISTCRGLPEQKTHQSQQKKTWRAVTYFVSDPCFFCCRMTSLLQKMRVQSLLQNSRTVKFRERGTKCCSYQREESLRCLELVEQYLVHFPLPHLSHLTPL